MCKAKKVTLKYKEEVYKCEIYLKIASEMNA